MESKLDYRIESNINAHTLGGILLLLVGIIAILNPFLFSKLLIYLVGIIFVLAGLVFGFIYFTTLGESRAMIAKSIAFLILGFISLFSPVLGLKILTIVLILFFLGAGITNFMLANSIRSQKGEILAIITGILSIFIDVVIILGWEVMSQFFVGLFIGIVLLMDGIIFVLVGLKIKRENWL